MTGDQMGKINYRRSVSLSPRVWIMITKLAATRRLSRTAVIEGMIARSCQDSGILVAEEEIEAFKQRCRDKRAKLELLEHQRSARLTF